MRTFRELGVSEEVVRALAARGIEMPFPIQTMVIEDATAGRDTLARSKTGSGKTLGFAIPIVDRLDPSAERRPVALVLTPTRELAQQVSDEFEDIARARALKVMAVYGGTRVREQSKGVGSAHILIATPGRLDDLIERKIVGLDGVRILVLDEADRMLDMGFQPQVDRIVKRLPRNRQTMFFSATLDGPVGELARAYTNSPSRIESGLSHAQPAEIEHQFVSVAHDTKVETLIEHIRAADSTLVFVRTKRGADRLVQKLARQGVTAVAMHGDMSQRARERALSKFETGKVATLVATDVAARGLDLDDVSHVINFDPPEEDKGYVHRTGRTGRAGRSGTAITFVLPDQQAETSRAARRLGHHDQFEQAGMKSAPAKLVYTSRRGRRSKW
jgi:superfamily II DNA/RNA helicase